MENWSNLNIYLTIANKDSKKQEELAKKLIDYCIKNDKSSIKKILKMGAPINCNDGYITPLIACMQNDNYDLAHYLLKAGARISFKPTSNFEDAFWYALKNKKHNFLEIFVAQKCILEWSIPKSENEIPQTPLIYATIQSDLRAVQILLKHYAIKVNERDGKGNTALHYNVSKQNMTPDDIEIGKLLIAAGADSSIANLDGKTPEDLAQDFASRTMLMANRLEQELPEKELQHQKDISVRISNKANNGIAKTKKGKLKI